MTGLPEVVVRLSPPALGSRDVSAVRDALGAELTRLAEALGAPDPSQVAVGLHDGPEWVDISLDGVRTGPTPELAARAAREEGPEAIDQYLAVVVGGLILLNRPRPLVGAKPAPPTLAAAESVVPALDDTGTTLAELAEIAWTDFGLPFASVEMTVGTGLPPGFARWHLGGVPMPPFRIRFPEPMESIRQAFATDVRWFGELLLDDRAIEHRLDDLALNYPDLVATARRRVPPEAMAHLLRTLTVEHIPLVYFAPIVEQAVEAKVAGVPDVDLVERVRRGIPRLVAAAAGT